MKEKKQHLKASLLTKVVLLVLLAAIGWRLYDLRGQVADAQAEQARYAAQVEERERENAALKADIEEGPTEEKLEDIARDELGYVKPDEYVFDPTNG